MFEGYLIGRRQKELNPNGKYNYTYPAIIDTTGAIKVRDHSQRVSYLPSDVSEDIEVFFVRIDESQVDTLRNDPETYLMDIDFEPVDLIPFANWLKAKGQTRGTFDPQVARYQQTKPEFVAAMQAVRDLL